LLRNHAQQIKRILKKASSQNIDTITLGHLNLWRSDTYYRVDNDYDWLHTHGVKAFWRNNGNLSFPETTGLHQPQYPSGMKSEIRINRNLIHRGFSTDYQIKTRYDVYRKKGQKGHNLDRLLDEKTLLVSRLDEEMLPEWFKITDDVNPKLKARLLEKK
jgi:hypothetical protein